MGADPALVSAVRRLRDRFAATTPLELVILFGSRARGGARPDSDADLMLVSPAFEGKSLTERASPLYLAWDSDIPADFVCYSPAEFERLRRQVSLVRVALDEGIEIAA